MKITEQTQDDVRNVCRHWYKYTLPTLRDLEGFVDDRYNADLLISFINYRCNGDYTLENLTAAAEHYKNNLHGVGVALSPAQKLEKEKLAAEKAAAAAKEKIDAANQKTIVKWLARECPLGLIVNGDLYGDSQDKVIAYFKRNYPQHKLITAAILSEAVTVMGPSLDWFDRNAMELRNQPPPPPRVMSEQMRIEAGLQPPRIPSHLDDKPMIPMSEVARTARALFEKEHGLPSEEEQWKNKAETISVTTKSGKFDHRRTQELRQIFVYTDNTKTKISWKQTAIYRNKFADAILREQQHD